MSKVRDVHKYPLVAGGSIQKSNHFVGDFLNFEGLHRSVQMKRCCISKLIIPDWYKII
ncbi:MAG TPA: hypothetical protein VF691_04880 [Cytophagaceae bacterium]